MAMVHASDMRAMVDEFAANRMWPWVLGAFNLLGGFIIITLHQYWRSVAAIIVSVLGWVLTLRGLYYSGLSANLRFARQEHDWRSHTHTVVDGLRHFGPHRAVSDLCWLDPRSQPVDDTTISSRPRISPRAA